MDVTPESCLLLVQDNNGPYFGGVVGRVANRIAGAKFSLDGQEHVLHANEGPNTLHSGPGPAWNNRVWDVLASNATSVQLALQSPAGDQARYHLHSHHPFRQHRHTGSEEHPCHENAKGYASVLVGLDSSEGWSCTQIFPPAVNVTVTCTPTPIE